MSAISGTTLLSAADLYTSTASPGDGLSLGQLAWGRGGKAFRYVLAGAANLVVGNVLQAPAINTQFDALAVVTGAKGSTTLVVTNGTTAVTAGQFKEGNVVVNVTPQLAEEYTIVDHSTAANGAAWTLQLDRPIRTAMTTSTRVVARRSPYSGVLQSIATTITGAVVGVAIYPIVASEYGWVQTKGVASVLADSSSILVGSGVIGGSTATAGACTLGIAGFTQIGCAMQAANGGKPIPVNLMID